VAALRRVPVHAGLDLHIVPGLRTLRRDGQYDVMRGEETQLWGAGLGPERCCVLPGTHSKWAWIGEAGAVARFETAMTGELFALLKQHSILGRLMPASTGPALLDGPQAEAFDRGARLGLHDAGRLLQALFAVRTAGLMQQLPAEALADFLSGLLIGAELAGALHGPAPAHAPVQLLGEPGLCLRYARALRLAGLASEPVPAGAAERGLWRLAVAAGLVAGPADAGGAR
jgi:2-dehydro-3-deoxygalactonokinase